MSRPIYVPPSGPPQDIRPSTEIHAAMGRDNLFAMCLDFYQRLAASDISELFPTNADELAAASRRQAMFLSGVLGGPPLYAELIGPPRMRARHIPFVINEERRQSWLGCFMATLDTPGHWGIPEPHLEGFKNFLIGFSAWMVNTAPKQPPVKQPPVEQPPTDEPE